MLPWYCVEFKKQSYLWPQTFDKGAWELGEDCTKNLHSTNLHCHQKGGLKINCDTAVDPNRLAITLIDRDWKWNLVFAFSIKVNTNLPIQAEAKALGRSVNIVLELQSGKCWGIARNVYSMLIRRKCTFSPYILHIFYFNSYIFISSLLVPKSINAFHFGSYRYLFNRNCWCGKNSAFLAH